MAFFQEATKGNQGLIDILVCFVMTLKGRAQRFLYLIGLGGTGKGTFIRLLLNLIGMSNACSSDLDDFCNNRFAARLSVSVVFADTDKQVGKLGKFLLLAKTFTLWREEGEDSIKPWSLSLPSSKAQKRQIGGYPCFQVDAFTTTTQ